MLKKSISYRLGIDLGANSLGWCALALDENGLPFRILAAGSRIYSDGRDPKSGASLAIDRRDARAMRRRRDRFLRRQAALIKHLTLAGFFPEDDAARKALETLDPFALRAFALDKALSLPEIGRAFFHLNQRRGFKSNRKADRKAGDEAGKIDVGIGRLEQAIREGGWRTFGEFLHQRRASAENQNTIPSVRTRLRAETGEGAKGDGYDFYPGRKLIAEEFDAIWEAQAPHHPKVMTPEVHARLFEIVFHQRPLRAPKIGKCTLIPEEERLPKAHPLFQRRRLLEELNALRIVRAGQNPEPLSRDQRDILFLKLKDSRKATFSSMRKALKLDPDARFNKESENRLELIGDEIAAEFGSKTRFANRWVHFSWETQWEVVSRIRETETEADELALVEWLKGSFGLSEEQAKAISAARLPEGFGRFGLSATQALIEEMTADVIVYSEAVERAGLHHSDFRTGEVFEDEAGNPALPYYGAALERHIMPGTADPDDKDEASRIGRITNPTVHIGLNQLRRLVNRLVRAHGKPAEIAIELARELKLSEEEKVRRNRDNNRNRVIAEDAGKKLESVGWKNNGANRALLKLWTELNPANVLDRRCIYTGQQISMEMLLSDAVEVDHILPFDATLDDSNANKIVCMREANRIKRKRSPYEAWGHTSQWEEIAARAARLPENKRWRFQPDAMKRFDKDGGFLARHLVDTQYLARMAHEYLATLYPEKGEGSKPIWVSPGRLTEMVRRKLGLNDLLPDHNFGGGADQPKNRLDHRHHAIDAFVIAIVDRAMLNRVSSASGQDGAEGRERIIIPPPWDGFRDELRSTVNGIVVSHRVDHGTVSKAGLAKGKDQTAGRLHNDTAYGLTGENDAKGNSIVVHRVPLTALKPEHFEPDPAKGVRDPILKAALREFTAGKEGKDLLQALHRFTELGPLQFRNIRRVRVVEPLSVIEIRDRKGRTYKGYKGDSNYRYDVWEMPDGKWQAEVVSMFDAHKAGWTSSIRQSCPTARKVLSLHQNDMLAIERNLERELVRIVKFSESQLALAAPNEGGSLKARDASKEDPFKYAYPSPNTLKKWRARQIRIDELGRVLDPGFPPRKAKRKTKPKPL